MYFATFIADGEKLFFMSIAFYLTFTNSQIKGNQVYVAKITINP
jgi:hypothetical protein